MTTHSRRDALKVLGTGAAALACTPCAQAYVDFLDLAAQERYFRLDEVRLQPGPFLDAQKLDATYLLQLEPDRLLHNFRVNAGLAPKAPVYGGWESVEPWIEIRCHGHTLGHYLTAAACMYESGDTRFAERVDYIVTDLAECQSKTGGWLTAFPDGVAPLVDSLAGKPFPGVPWYTTHKVMAGLRDAHLHRGSKLALEVLLRFAEWIDATSTGVPDDQMQKMLDREHGGMNEVLADLASITKDSRFGDLAERFSHRALLDPLAARRDTLDGLHANTQIPKVVGFSRVYEVVTQGKKYKDAAEFFWDTVVGTRSFATGGHGDVEHFFPRHEFVKRLGSGKTMETCCTHNMMRLTRSLYARNAKASYMDYFERALFNGILASQDPATGMMTYFQSTRPGYVRLYHTPFDSFWCCTGSGLENHARYGETIYAHDGDVLVVNLFIASTVEWRARGVTMTQETRFPDSDTTRLTFKLDRARVQRLAIRKPAWCDGLNISVNGKTAVTSDGGRGYRYLERRFRSGDVVEVRAPMKLRLETLPAEPEVGALMYGPIVLAGRLGTAGLAQGSQLIINERESGNMLDEKVDIPRWNRPLADLVANTTRTDAQTLRFLATGFEGGKNVELIPWFRMTHERYNLYWQGKPT